MHNAFSPIGETDLSQETSWFYETLAQKAIKSLERNNIPAEFASNRSQALSMLAEAIPPGSSVGNGDSVTLHEIGLFSWLQTQSLEVLNPYQQPPDGPLDPLDPKRYELMRKAMVADVFIASSNALTLDGKLVNIDGRGNRVAPMLFGPKKTILVIGANKIVKDVDEALYRIKNYVAPLNNKRHIYKQNREDMCALPCVITGSCSECHGRFKVCRKITIIDGQNRNRPEGVSGIYVIIVGESLGL